MFTRVKMIRRILFRQNCQLRCNPNISRSVHELKGIKSLITSNENNALYEHLKLRQNYRQTLAFLDYVKEKSMAEDADMILRNEPSQIPLHKLVDSFRTICQSYCCDPERLNDPKFVILCEFLIEKIPELTDEQLMNTLKILTLWPRIEDGNDDLFYRLCKAVDDHLCQRGALWDRNKMLLVIDHFHRLGVINFSSYSWKNLGKLCRNPERLTPSQLVQTLFLVMCNRKWHPGVDHFKWEDALANNIYELSVEEATIVALGFFKTNKRITNHSLLNALIMKLESRMDTLDSISLTAILKVIRFSLPNYMRYRLIPLLDKLKDVIDEKSLTCCVHIASLGTGMPFFHEELLNKIYKRFVKEISTARLKEIERMLFVASLFDFNPSTDPNFFDLAIEELKSRDVEVSQHPYAFIYAVQFLGVKGIFDFQLLNKVLSENFLTDTFKQISKFSIPCNVVQIACSAKLDCPDYNGNNLDVNLINDFNEQFNCRSPAVRNSLRTKREIAFFQAKTKLEEMFGGPEFVHLTHVLPYCNTPHLIFCQENNKPVVLPEEIRNKYCVDFEPASKIGSWYAIEVWSNGSKIGNTGEPVGSVRCRQKHLRALGYKCSLLDEDKWNDLDTNKVQYLKSLIKSCS